MLLDVTVEEAKRLAAIQEAIQLRYTGKPKDLVTWGRLADELRTLCNDAGFEVEVHMDSRGGNWNPVVDIVGRTDKSLEATVAREGTNVERRRYEATRESSAQLEAQGVNVELLG